MFFHRMKASCSVALATILVATAQAGQDADDGRDGFPKTRVVKRADGSEVVRLATLQHEAAMRMDSPSSLPPGVISWLASLEPRPTTALATLPARSRQEARNLPAGVDPSRVRSWAEFTDPALALQGLVLARLGGFSEALLQRPDPGVRAEQTGISPQGTTVVRTVSEGAKPSLSGRLAIQAWLTLPRLEPRANPWLSNLGSYRY
ncbi:MAG: hypothetical protein H6935_10600 [Thiobacillus sp.]|nr:hypothetical protein [Thiobacillus sp.]